MALKVFFVNNTSNGVTTDGISFIKLLQLEGMPLVRLPYAMNQFLETRAFHMELFDFLCQFKPIINSLPCPVIQTEKKGLLSKPHDVTMYNRGCVEQTSYWTHTLIQQIQLW